LYSVTRRGLHRECGAPGAGAEQGDVHPNAGGADVVS
jgi:hypothetical protein